jgi:hypothetical protein
MASLLNNASLLLNPAGSIISYQEDKIYSVLPKDGTGDFTFSGGDGGTRVNQQGYIEQTPANYALQSNAFSTAPWSRQNTILTSGQSDPLGGTNAWKVEFSAAQAFLYQYTAPITGVVTISAYLRADSTTTIGFNDGAGNPNSVTIGTTWQLYTFTYTVSSIYYIIQFDNYFGVSPANQPKTFYVYGAQLNIGSTAKPYQPTTDRLNYPRITYQNGRGALLQEPQRTNLATYSEDLTNGVWALSNVSITSNNITSPDGTQNADRVTRTSTANTFFYNTNTTTSSNRANSMFLKKGTIDQATILGNSYSSGTYATFNLSNGTIISSTGCTPFIEQYKDGWYRCGIIQTNGVSYVLIATLNGYNNDTVTSGEYLYAWGGQTELGEFPTTYIPTTSATVTRPLDQFFNNDSPALNTTNWTFYMSGVNIGKNQNSSGNNIDNVNWSFDSGAGPYGPNSLHNYSNIVYYYDTVNGPANLGSIGNTTTKFAVTKNGTTFKLFRDGVLFSTNVLSLASNVWDSFRMYGVTDAQGQAFSNNPSTLAILPSALSDAEAQTLTTVRSGSGGNISYYGPYTIHTFTGSATFTPSFTGPVEVLVVAGGGGGGYDNGGGGGAGGLLYASSYGVAQGTGITVTIGAGGVGGPNGSTKGTNGGNSVFGGLTALGGGGGGSDVNRVGLNGGSGGGTARAEGGSASGLGTPGQGNNGGSAPTSPSTVNGGGGGGAGQVGETSTVANRGGNGGNGLVYSINGFSTYYAGGGGGGSASGESRTNGGLGGGGFGSTGNVYNPTGGTDYLGGGGGGGPGSTSPRDGKNGGIGIVIVRYLT